MKRVKINKSTLNLYVKKSRCLIRFALSYIVLYAKGGRTTFFKYTIGVVLVAPWNERSYPPSLR